MKIIFFVLLQKKKILQEFLNKSKINNSKKINIKKCLNKTIIFDLKNDNLKVIDHQKPNLDILSTELNENEKLTIFNNLSDEKLRLKNLKKCSKCVLPETYPFIKFDSKNVCNFCNDYEKQKFQGEEKLNKLFDKHRSKNGKIDCIVGLSGGRDSFTTYI